MPNGITTDQLNIKITVDSSGAIEGIDKVKEALGQLTDVAGSRNLTTLKDVASAFDTLTKSSAALAQIDFKGLGSGIQSMFESLGHFDNESLSKNVADFGTALEKMTGPLASFLEHTNGLQAAAIGINKLQDALNNWGEGPDVKQIKKMEEPLRTLGEVVSGIGRQGNNLNQLKNGINGMTNALKNFSVGPKDAEKLTPFLNSLAYVLNNFSEVSQKGASAVYRVGNALRVLNSTGFDANLFHNFDKAGKALKSFVDDVSGVLGSFGRIATSGTSALHHLATAIRSLNEVGGDDKLPKNLQAASEAIVEFVNKTIEALPEEVIDRFIRLGEAIKDIVKIKAAEKAVDSWGNATKRATSHGSTLKNILKKIGSVLLSSMVYPFKLAAKAAGSLASALKKVGSAMLKVTLAPLKAGVNAVKGFGNAFKKLGHTIGRLVLYRVLRSMIRAVTQQVKLGIDALYNWSDVVGYRFKAAMDGLATSFQYLRNSVAAMVSPLIEYLQPVIDVLIDKFVEFLNVVNQFFATLTGKETYVRAIKGAAAYAEETEYAAAAQEKLNRTILGFDELNKLNDTKDRAHGSPSDNAGGGEFEEVPITESFDKIKWGDLGKKLSDGLVKALDGIDWNKIQRNVNIAAGKVVSFFNGFFGNETAWQSTGTTLGNAINTLTGAITTFTGGVKWEDVGSGIAAGYKAAVETVDWKKTGKTIASGAKIFSKLFHGFVNSMTKSDWKNLGTAIGDVFNSAISEIAWDEVIPDLFSFASGLFTAIIAAIEQIDFDKFAKKIEKGFENANWKTAISDFSVTLKNFILNALNGIKWDSIQTTVNDVVGAIAGLFNTFFADKKTWETVGTTVGNTVNTLIKAVLTFTDGVKWEDVGKGISDGIKSAVDTINWSDVGKGIATVAKIFINLFHGFISGTTMQDWKDIGSSIGEAITTAINEINWLQFTFDLLQFALGLANAAIGALEKVDIAGSIKKMFTDISFEEVKNFFKSFAQTLVNIYDFIRPALAVLLGQDLLAAFDNGIDSLRKLAEMEKRNERSSSSHSGTSRTSESAYSSVIPGKNYFEEFTVIDFGEEFVSDFSSGISNEVPRSLRSSLSEFTGEINGTLNSQDKRSPLMPYTHGQDYASNYAAGLQSYTSIDKIKGASKKIAQTIRDYTAFCKPKYGPLSDADEYGPDFVKLFAAGIENSKNLVTNAVSGLASDVNSQMALENTYTLHNEPTGLDSLAQAITNSETPINVYIGSDKLDSVIARSNSRLNYRSGGRF